MKFYKTTDKLVGPLDEAARARWAGAANLSRGGVTKGVAA